MEICKLCKSKPANQTGSHIFTYALIKRAINKAGETKRNKELTFTISSKDLVANYFGRDILPETMQETLKREITDEEIEKNINPFTIDNIVCSDCEKRFTTAENYFHDNVYTKLHEQKYVSINDSKGNQIFTTSGINTSLLRLCIYIQFWRASVVKDDNLRLNADFEEKLRKIIDENLNLSLPETLRLCVQNKAEINSFPVILTFGSTQVESTDKYEFTENMIYVDKSQTPYFVILNDLFLQLYQKPKQLRRTKEYFFGLNVMIDKNEHANINEDNFKIGVLADAKRKSIVLNLVKLVAQRTLEYWSTFFSDIHKELFGVKPTKELFQKAVLAITNSDVSLSDRYSVKNLISKFSEILYSKINR